jgi:hypothetical protein
VIELAANQAVQVNSNGLSKSNSLLTILNNIQCFFKAAMIETKKL